MKKCGKNQRLLRDLKKKTEEEKEKEEEKFNELNPIRGGQLCRILETKYKSVLIEQSLNLSTKD